MGIESAAAAIDFAGLIDEAVRNKNGREEFDAASAQLNGIHEDEAVAPLLANYLLRRPALLCVQPNDSHKGQVPPMLSIQRFLESQCPRTVDECKMRFGEPRMDMGNELAREYSVWTIDGSPIIDVDYLMIYANVLRDQVLYVDAKAGTITHIAVLWPRRTMNERPSRHARALAQCDGRPSQLH
jgi:hypothetical protein